MRIIITNREDKIELTDEQLKNDNFVTLLINDIDIDISIEELYSAVKTFYERREENAK